MLRLKFSLLSLISFTTLACFVSWFISYHLHWQSRRRHLIEERVVLSQDYLGPIPLAPGFLTWFGETRGIQTLHVLERNEAVARRYFPEARVFVDEPESFAEPPIGFVNPNW